MDGDTTTITTKDNEPGESTDQRVLEPDHGSVTPAKEDNTGDGDGIFRCRHCGEAFRDETAYTEHRRQHAQDNSGERLHPPLDGSQTDAEKDSPITKCCALCSLSFAGLSDFNSHMVKHHSQTPQTESVPPVTPGAMKHIYECPDCGKTYGVIGHFLNHQRSHKQASKSVFHELEHLKKKSFQCEMCGRSYSRASALDAHRHCHEGKLIKSRSRSAGDSSNAEEPAVEAVRGESQTEIAPEKLFECSCGKGFPTQARMKTHQRFSHNIKCSPEQLKEKTKKLLACSECKKTFSSHIALVNHQRWHVNHSDDVKKFPCEECGKVFMTLTFYYKHQRLAHSEETPAKSFLHQVCQLQKKAFECKDCGLKFSRATALQSHQLCHTDVFRGTEEPLRSTSPLPQRKVSHCSKEEPGRLAEGVESLDTLKTSVTEEDSHVDVENDEDMEGYETGDFNVEVISASESDDEQPLQDLELLCESDQEVKYGLETEVSPTALASKPEIDLKIVQIDFEQLEDQGTPGMPEVEDKPALARFDCPECYRWFQSASSLRIHRMWHKKKQQPSEPTTANVYTCDICGHQASSRATHYNHRRTHKEEQRSIRCDECGRCFSRKAGFISHQLHHHKRKPFSCPDCSSSYSYRSGLHNHKKNCLAQKVHDDISEEKKVFNPKKTLLGPKIYHCEQCGKGFWSLGAYSHHKQSQTPCADLRERKGLALSSQPANGHIRRTNVRVACPVCGRKFRHSGIMKSHMRKHENGDHKCELCGRTFRLFSSLLRHQVVHSAQLLPPPIKSFQHQVEQVKKNTYSCPDCGKLFSRAKALQFHMKSHGYETGYSPSSPRSDVKLEELQCSTCLAHFKNKSSLRAHQKLCIKRETDGQGQDGTRPVSSDASNVLKCSNCPSHFKTALSLQNHVKRCSSSSATKGDLDPEGKECSETFSRDAEIKSELDTGELKMTDEIAPFTLEKAASSTDLKYKCKDCERSFSVVGALNFHKRIHLQSHKSKAKAKLNVKLNKSTILKKPEQEKQPKGMFSCSECGRQFTSNSALGTHKRWHTDKKLARSLVNDDNLGSKSGGPFSCDKCGKGFFYLRILRRHHLYCPSGRAMSKLQSEVDKSLEGSSTLPSPSADGKSVDSADPQDQAPGQPDVARVGAEAVSPAKLKSKAHPCPHCSKTFGKVRGLRAHKWQAHSKEVDSVKSKDTIAVSGDVVDGSKDVSAERESATVSKPTVVNKKGTFGKRRKKNRINLPPLGSIPCPDCGKRYSSAGALYNHKKVCLEHKQEIQTPERLEHKQEIQTPELAVEVPPLPQTRQPDHTVKYLFKCGKCGKAFQTEEQLGTHKTQSKSRPYSCALCCHGYWTETQLQSHLSWHDEVRRRLPIELRHRLSTSLTPGPPKPNFTSPEKKGNSSVLPALNPASRSQTSHKCQHCGKAFLSPSALQKHEAQHDRNHSYHCSICPKTFSEIQDLIDHHQECMGNHKGQSDALAAVSSLDTDGLTCLECGSSFSQEIELHQHYIEHARGAY